MGTVSLPSLDAIMQIKDPNRRFEELVNTMGILIKNLSEINGYLSSKNIKAQSIKTESLAAGAVTAEKIDVNELSAITANLGTILAGVIIGIQIYGAYIATAQGTYPRAEMSSAEDLFAAYATADNFLKIYAIESGTPMVYFSNLSSIARLFLNGSVLSLANFGTLLLSATGDITIQSTNPTSDVILKSGTSGYVTVDAWSKLFSTGDGQTLQTVINNIYSAIAGKANAFSGYTGSYSDGTNTITVNNGIITSVV